MVESQLLSLKTKDFINSLKNILGERLFEVALKNKSVRAGKGKLRGRKYKKNAGLLVVTGKKEKIKTRITDFSNSENLSVVDLAKCGLGRLVIYTEEAINEIGKRFEHGERPSVAIRGKD